MTSLKQFATRIQYSLIALTLAGACASLAVAQENHVLTADTQQVTPQDDQNNAETLVRMVRDATEKYKDVAAAQAAGYALNFGCVSGDEAGAMGLHYVNGALVNSGVIDVNRPQIVIYEATANGNLKLIGADFLVIADQWNASHSGPPELFGQLFHLFPSPNRFGLPAFYTLHVWAWKDNPKGAYVNWHPNVSCAAYTTKKP
jgi:hypothetical protein